MYRDTQDFLDSVIEWRGKAILVKSTKVILGPPTWTVAKSGPIFSKLKPVGLTPLPFIYSFHHLPHAHEPILAVQIWKSSWHRTVKCRNTGTILSPYLQSSSASSWPPRLTVAWPTRARLLSNRLLSAPLGTFLLCSFRNFCWCCWSMSPCCRARGIAWYRLLSLFTVVVVLCASD